MTVNLPQILRSIANAYILLQTGYYSDSYCKQTNTHKQLEDQSLHYCMCIAFRYALIQSTTDSDNITIIIDNKSGGKHSFVKTQNQVVSWTDP